MLSKLKLTQKTRCMSIDSPCIRNCCLNEQDVCIGCFRSLSEIKQWSVVDDETRRFFFKKSIARQLEFKR